MVAPVSAAEIAINGQNVGEIMLERGFERHFVPFLHKTALQDKPRLVNHVHEPQRVLDRQLLG
jgi:hypothetical protein